VTVIPFPSPLDASAFDPDGILIMSDAFEDAWQSLHSPGTAVRTAEKEDNTRAMLASCIIEQAKAGERDRHTLRDAGLFHLAELIVRNARA
jgi:hypothetical protein